MRLEILPQGNDILEEGTEWRLKARLIINTKWKSKITYLKPYEYVDEMINGRFKIWKHLHKFNEISNNRTEIIDLIDFHLPFGVVGKLLENYTMDKLDEIFEFRKKATIETLQKDLQI